MSVAEAEDDLLAQLPPAPAAPVFVIGLHRSGTTWLYELLCRCFELSPVTVHTILCYDELLLSDQQQRTAADQAAVDARLAALGLTTRQVDAIALSHATVEEYGWVLQRQTGRLTLSARTLPVLEALCRKLRALRPDAQGVALKSPWDTANVPAIQRLLPGAKFVFIARDPVAILSSQLENGLLFSSTQAPFLMLLLEKAPLLRAGIGLQRLLYRLLGERGFAWLLTRLLMSDVIRELAAYQRSWEQLQPGRGVEVTYGELTRDPRAALARIGELLGRAPTRLHEVVAKPRRRRIHPAVEAVAPRLRARLAAKGLLRDDLE